MEDRVVYLEPGNAQNKHICNQKIASNVPVMLLASTLCSEKRPTFWTFWGTQS